MSKKIGVLTSSRADFGIYLPLLKALDRDDFFTLEIIAFGTHLSESHGYTLNDIHKEGFVPRFTIDSVPQSDTEEAIASSIGLTIMKFSSFWKEFGNTFDLVFCIGDRYEMFAAVVAGIPFQVDFAHIHGGEKTLGAIDNIFRHSMSHTARIHFTSTPQYKERVEQLVDEPQHVYYTGSLSLDNLSEIPLMDIGEFKEKWGVDLNKRTILTTFHPETVNVDCNLHFAEEIAKAVRAAGEYQFLITMPNADTAGNTVRDVFTKELSGAANVYLIENLGTRGYFSAMKYCSLMLGNTSSGIIESASFEKYVINLGNRQEGRACNENVITIPITADAITYAINQFSGRKYLGENIYYKAKASLSIINILRTEYFNEL